MAISSERLLETIEEARVHDHLCLLYRDRDEELAAAIAFIKAGLESNDMCIYVADDNALAHVDQAMRRAGIDTAAAIKRGQLSLTTKRGSYVPRGRFDPEQAIDFFAEAAVQAQSHGWRALRGDAEMTWQLAGDPGSERFIEYEAKMNRELFPDHKVMGLCQFNMRRFSAATIRDVLYTHPRVIIGNLVCKNFYYKSPEEFLAEDDPQVELNRMLENILLFEKSEMALRQSQIALSEANDRLEDKVRQRTAELEHKAQQLRELNANLAGREYRIRELERETALLRARLVRGPK